MGWRSPIVTASQVIITGANGGEFIYDASGNLRSANVGQTTTDPLQGITCQQGFSTFNGFGAVISLLSTANAAYFQYLDSGSAVQGSLSISQAARSGTDPVTSTAYPQGMQIFNGALQFLTPVAHPGQIGVAGAGPLAGYMQFLNAVGYQFDAAILGNINALDPSVPNTVETWHTMSGFLNSWAATGNTPRYRLLPDGNVQIDGAMDATAATAATFFTMPAAYRPVAPTKLWSSGANLGVPAGQSPFTQVASTGSIAVLGVTLPTAGAHVTISGIYTLT
jgi:hypothetical protein